MKFIRTQAGLIPIDMIQRIIERTEAHEASTVFLRDGAKTNTWVDPELLCYDYVPSSPGWFAVSVNFRDGTWFLEKSPLIGWGISPDRAYPQAISVAVRDYEDSCCVMAPDGQIYSPFGEVFENYDEFIAKEKKRITALASVTSNEPKI